MGVLVLVHGLPQPGVLLVNPGLLLVRGGFEVAGVTMPRSWDEQKPY